MGKAELLSEGNTLVSKKSRVNTQKNVEFPLLFAWEGGFADRISRKLGPILWWHLHDYHYRSVNPMNPGAGFTSTVREAGKMG